MENKSYELRYLPIFEQDLIGTANCFKKRGRSFSLN